MHVLIPFPPPKQFLAAWYSALFCLLGTLTHVHGNVAPDIHNGKERPAYEIESI